MSEPNEIKPTETEQVVPEWIKERLVHDDDDSHFVCRICGESKHVTSDIIKVQGEFYEIEWCRVCQ